MFGHILRHGATAVAASAISVSLIAGIGLAGVTPLTGPSRDRSQDERSAACFAITDPAELDVRIAELQADLDARLEAAVAAGVLTAETAAEISARVTTFLERCRDVANEPDRSADVEGNEPDPSSDAKEHSKEHSRDRGLGEIFRLVAGREIGSFFRACFDPTFADGEAELEAALVKLNGAIDAAVAAGDITAERGVELKDRLGALVERCGSKDGTRGSRGSKDGLHDRGFDRSRDWSDWRRDGEKPAPATTPVPEVRSFEEFRPTSTATPVPSSTNTWGSNWGSRTGTRSWSGSGGR